MYVVFMLYINVAVKQAKHIPLLYRHLNLLFDRYNVLVSVTLGSLSVINRNKEVCAVCVQLDVLRKRRLDIYY